MPSYIFFSLAILSPWPLFYSYLFYYSKDDESFRFLIKSKAQLYKYLSFVGLYILFFAYIFFYRLWGITRIYNIFDFYEKAKIWFSYIILTCPPSTIILIMLFGIFWIIYIFLQILWLTAMLKKLYLSLYLYFYQYSVISQRLQFRENLVKKYSNKLWVKLYRANNKSILADIVRWFPYVIFDIEWMLYRFLLPYLGIFDYMVNYGNISKMFKIVPWLYLYTLGKAFFKYLNKFYKVEHIIISRNAYGSRRSIITGERLGPGKYTRKAMIKRFLEHWNIIKKI